MKARKKSLIFGLLLSGVFLGLIYSQIDLEDLQQALLRSDPRFLFLTLLTIAAYFWVKTWRWKILLVPVGKTSLKELISPILIGTSCNYLLFGYLGELVRTWLLGKDRAFKKSSIFMSVVLEKMLDTFTILILIGSAFLFASEFNREWISAAIAAAVCAAIGAGVLTALICRPEPCLALIKRCTDWLSVSAQRKIMDQLEWGLVGIQAIARPRLAAYAAAGSLLQWLLMAAVCYFPILAVGESPPFYAVFIVITLIVLSTTFPNAPGHIGLIELCFMIGLAPFGVGSSEALAAGILYHAILYLSVILAGGILLQIEGLGYRQIRREAKKEYE